jgi:hypothetical protein
MNSTINNCHTVVRQCFSLFVVVLYLLLYGCGGRQPAMSEAARTFQKEALEMIKRLSPTFTDLLAQNNPGAVQAALEKLISDAGSGGGLNKFKIAIIDRNGIKITGRFRAANEAMNFSNYTAAKKILQQREIASEVLYLRGSKVCVIGAPLVHKGTIVGALALAVSATDLQDQWHVTENEFKQINFN